MSQRTDKVASLVQQLVAGELREQLTTPHISVTAVDVSPDLRQATVWLSLIANSQQEQEELMRRAVGARGQIQRAVAARMTTKFVPRIHFKHDGSGQYAEHIARIMNEL